MKRVEVINKIWDEFKPKNRFDLNFEHRYIFVANILPALEQDYSRITILEARKAIDVRAGHIAGRHVWWAPRISLDRVLRPDLKIDSGRKNRKRERQISVLLDKFKAFMKDMRFAVVETELFAELKLYLRPHSFTYAALSGVKKELRTVLYEFEGKKYRLWPGGTVNLDIGDEIEQETLGNWIEGCFEERKSRELSEEDIREMCDQIHPAALQYVLRQEFMPVGPGRWRSRSF